MTLSSPKPFLSSFIEKFKNLIFSKSFLMLLVLLFPGILIAAFMRARGFVYTGDSEWYLMLADYSSQGFLARNPRYAPLYSWCLAFIRFFGFTFKNVQFIYVCLVFIGFLLAARKYFRSVTLAFLFFILIIRNPTVFEIFSHVWTELGYSLLLFLCGFSLIHMIGNAPKNLFTRYDLLFLCSIALLPLQRYIGGYVAWYLGCLYLALHYRKPSILSRFTALFISSVPTVLMLFWNLYISGGIAGEGRDPAIFTLFENVQFMKRVLVQFFSVEFFLFVFSVIGGIFLIRRKHISVFWLAVLAIPIVQLLAQLHSSSIYRFDKINPRFVVVIAPLVIFNAL
ncbi:MAG: hypothetical protein KDK51_09775, partial [Deltaproteobacteria bacterium]|nr:hypothetical protein [Deltaproteobacteria bacterium]